MYLNNKKAFTLIEVIIAIIVATIVFVGFMGSCNMAAYMLQDIKYRTRAVNIMQAEIEDLKAHGYKAINIADYTPFEQTSVVIDYGPTSSTDDDVIGEMRISITNAALAPTDGRKIVAIVTWPILGENKQEIIETAIYSRD